MSDRFAEQVLQHRPQLLAHCYRMTGALSDAEDALQDALIRAWRSLPAFEGRSSLRTWLYKITTNACLDLLANRRARTMPEHVEPTDEATADPAWLEPLPTPDAVYASREAVRLAFVIALQVLPPRQRAVLILRDVVGFSAEETARILETSVAAVNSALQRARAELEAHPRASKKPVTGAIGELLGKYLRLWEAGDAPGLVELLRSDATLSMPPLPMWASGPEAIAQLLDSLVFPRGAMRLIPCNVNGAPGFGTYVGGEFAALSVLDVEGGRIVAIQSFLSLDPTTYGLPTTLSPDTRVDLIPGAELGRYRLECPIGRGGMGQVWRARDRDLERDVAIKVVRPELAADGDVRARLLREARAMARLQHPNVIAIYDVAELAGHDMLVMELVDGETLGRWAARQDDYDPIVEALVAAGRGLAAAHDAGIVHRDFKPDNVLVGRDGRVRVGDFGLAHDEGGTVGWLDGDLATRAERPVARIQEAVAATVEVAGPVLTAEGTVMGTPAYMAPEQLRGEPVDARTDQFAFCLSAWELLAGIAAYSTTELRSLAAGNSIPPGDAHRIPEPIRGVLTRGLEPDPAARWSSMPALLDALTG